MFFRFCYGLDESSLNKDAFEKVLWSKRLAHLNHKLAEQIVEGT